MKKPLVLSNGNLEQLQKGDILIPSPDRVPLISDDFIIIGMPVYISSSNHCKRAKADSIITTNPIGLCFDNKLVQTNGTIFSNNWDFVVEELGGLIPGRFYYLSDRLAGKITKKPPMFLGHFIVQIGVAISRTRFEIRIGTPIKC